jgi:hypothetical protein
MHFVYMETFDIDGNDMQLDDIGLNYMQFG